MDQETLSQFSDPGLIVGGHGIIAAYPQGALGTKSHDGVVEHEPAWMGAPYANTTVDDIQFVKDILQDLSANMCVDNTRMYATGKSNGGGFVNLLACREDTAALLAAFVPVSPALYGGTLSFSGCNPGRPIPLITFHGLNDTVIPYMGQTGNEATPNIDTWRGQWAERNGCLGHEASLPAPDISATVYGGSTLNSTWVCVQPIQAYSVNGLGHSWPTTLGLDPSGGSLRFATFNATSPAIIAFLNNHILASNGTTTTTAAATTSTTSTPTTTTTATTTTTVGATQTHYGQCGGTLWTGPTVCTSPYACQPQVRTTPSLSPIQPSNTFLSFKTKQANNAYYSQCLKIRSFKASTSIY